MESDEFKNARDDRLEDIAATPCGQCGKPLGFEIFLGPVCGRCCKENHRRVTRSGMHSRRVSYDNKTL